MSVNLVQNSLDSKGNDLVIFIDNSSTVAPVPVGWRRVLSENNRIVYITPSQQILNSLDEVSNYLLSADTCKCGLSCPLYLEFFNFDPQVDSVDDIVDETKLNCKHRQKQQSDNNQQHQQQQMVQHHQTGSTASTSSSVIYQQPKVVYASAIQQAQTSNSPISVRHQTTPTKLVQNTVASHGNRTSYPITVLNQSNSQQAQEQIFRYIPIHRDNLNMLAQPIIFASPIKSINNTVAIQQSPHQPPANT